MRLNYCCDQYHKYWPSLITSIQQIRLVLNECLKKMRSNPAWGKTTPKEQAQIISQSDRVNRGINNEEEAKTLLPLVTNQCLQGLVEFGGNLQNATELRLWFEDLNKKIPLNPKIRQLTDER
jgi:hypothetical protein